MQWIAIDCVAIVRIAIDCIAFDCIAIDWIEIDWIAGGEAGGMGRAKEEGGSRTKESLCGAFQRNPVVRLSNRIPLLCLRIPVERLSTRIPL